MARLSGGAEGEGRDGVLWERWGGGGGPTLVLSTLTADDTDPCVCRTDKGAGKRQERSKEIKM